ncbi:hypothetical protein [Pragia fontium]|uniref:hypothetical protein n=1 Tax=Pragia fontium TaxID=82985 RepID=UPI000F6B70AA|nr:hypothetical protein [Pragia fontium]VEJ54645.1 Uncharacterised protein [Pragia fontium]
MSLNRNELAGYYSSKFSQLAVKKHNGTYDEEALEVLIKEAMDHMKVWVQIPYEENLTNFIAQVKYFGGAKDVAYESRQELLKDALPLIEKYK